MKSLLAILQLYFLVANLLVNRIKAMRISDGDVKFKKNVLRCIHMYFRQMSPEQLVCYEQYGLHCVIQEMLPLKGHAI